MSIITSFCAKARFLKRESKLAKEIPVSKFNGVHKMIQLGLEGITEVSQLSIKDLIVELGDFDSGFVGALADVSRGNPSRTKAPIQVTWLIEEDKFLVTDGLHRLVEKVLSNSDLNNILCEIDWSGFELAWSIPNKDNRLL